MSKRAAWLLGLGMFVHGILIGAGIGHEVLLRLVTGPLRDAAIVGLTALALVLVLEGFSRSQQ